MDRCEECGYEYDMEKAATAGRAIQRGAGELQNLLRTTPAGELRVRQSAEVWSPLEYGCHVRDVLLVQRERLLLARREVRPSLAQMGRDERVEHDGYAEQEPEDVARQLGDAALMFANDLDRLTPADWSRTLMYNFPEPSERTLRWVAVHTVHEVEHHLADVRVQLD